MCYPYLDDRPTIVCMATYKRLYPFSSMYRFGKFWWFIDAWSFAAHCTLRTKETRPLFSLWLLCSRLSTTRSTILWAVWC